MPIELVFLRYRQAFNLSWNDFLETPWNIVQQDLEILSIESNIVQSKQKGKYAPTRRK